MSDFFKLLAVLMLFVLTGCVADQRDRRLVRPLEKMAAPYDNGTIFKPGFNERPLYEEKRARNVGDGLIMNVPESALSAKKTDSKDGKKKGETDTADAAATDQKRRIDSGEDGYISYIDGEVLVGTIPMTVISVMDNGYLFVAGGKMVTVNDEDKYVRITGVVDPAYITGGNIVQSTLVSDVHINVDDLRIYSDGTAINFTEGQATFGNLFQSMQP